MKVRAPCQQTITAFFTSPKTSQPLQNNQTQSHVGEKRKLLSTDVTNPVELINSHYLEAKILCKGKENPKDISNTTKSSCGYVDPLCESEMDKIALNKLVAEIRRNIASRSNKNVLTLTQSISSDWMCLLSKEIQSQQFQNLADFIQAERNNKAIIYPPIDQIFTWSKLCSPTDVRVVILGQDPYHGPRQAHGLAFSVCRPLPAPPSLINIYKEISSSIDAGHNWPPNHGDLTNWAKQGVLLLNSVLTVRASVPNSHKDKGWEIITDGVLRYLNKERSNLVFMLWGAHAQKQGASIDRKRHLVLEAPHPSPLSASRGFFGCGHFVKANDYLKAHKFTPINWTTLD